MTKKNERVEDRLRGLWFRAILNIYWYTCINVNAMDTAAM